MARDETYTLMAARDAAVSMQCGEQAPSVKLACWFSICSGAQRLEGANSDLADILRGYASRRLPERDTVVSWLRQCKANWNGRTLDGLYAIDELWACGVLARFETMPDSLPGWQDWRRELRSLVRGMSWKMCSMAAYLLWPCDCSIVCIDRHHLRRLGYNPDRVPQTERAYSAIEAQVLSEWAEYCDDLVSPAVWAHFAWSLERKRQGIEPDDNTAADHTRLSVRTY
jgi:hypothetical protein